MSCVDKTHFVFGVLLKSRDELEVIRRCILVKGDIIAFCGYLQIYKTNLKYHSNSTEKKDKAKLEPQVSEV